MPHSRVINQPTKAVARSDVRRSKRRPVGPFSSLFFGAGNRAVARLIQTKLLVNRHGDRHEQEADAAAARVVNMRAPATQVMDARAPLSAATTAARLPFTSSGAPLPREVRSFMEPRFGADFENVRVHTGEQAHALNRALNAEAFSHGGDVYYGTGRSPATDALTAHELAHVLQQRDRSGSVPDVQCTRAGSFPLTLGVLEVDLETREGALNVPPTKSGLDGYIRFVPNLDAPNSNEIVFVQVAKVSDTAGVDIAAASIPAAQAPRGAIGQGGLRSQDDLARGIEGGFLVDVLHQAGPAGIRQQGDPVAPRYPVGVAAPGTVGWAGTTVQPAQYGGGTGATLGQTPGFKRSNNPADIRSAAMYDFPGTPGRDNLDFGFESIARGEDTLTTYGGLRWGFGLRAGHVVSERFDVVDTASATFNETLERFRDFYVHEPVTVYFDFDLDILNRSETAKIDAFLDYLGRNPTVVMSIEGFADIHGGASAHNRDLADRRAMAVAAAILARGIDATRIHGVTVGSAGAGISTAATTDAGTGDQGGDAAIGADQAREANRWPNRRVVITFSQTASVVRPLAGGGTGP